MKNIDLDTVIDQTRESIRDTFNIEIEDKFEEISIGKILSEINEQAEKMVDSSESVKTKKYVSIHSNQESKKIKLLKKIDKRIRRLSLYENTIRPYLRKKIDGVYTAKTIDVKELLKFEDEEFVDVLYRSILFREADLSGKENILQILRKTGSSKIDLIYNLSQSDEAKKKNILVKGIRVRRTYLLIKRALLNLPIIGYVLRLGINLCLLPKRLRNFQNAFDDIYNQIRLLNIRSSNIEQNIDNIEQNIDNIEQNNINVECVVNDLNTKSQEAEVLQKEADDKQKKNKEIMDRFYVRYNEVLLPDSREEVKNRARVYIDKLNNWFEGKNKSELCCVDLGCGEGEWIELLNENGFSAKGVDSNTCVVEKVKKTLPQINIEEIDALNYLRGLKDDTVDLLTSFHMVEHLEMIEIIELLSECKRVLNKGGILIMETPNPQNIITSSYYFNMDPTHKKPIPPELLAFFVNESGLTVKEKILLYPLEFIPYEYRPEDPIKDIIFRFNMEQAYSVLAVKE